MKKIISTGATLLALALLPCGTAEARAGTCSLTPKEDVTRFIHSFYGEKKVREAFETWVDPGYIQHNPMAKTGRDAAVAFLEPFFANTPGLTYEVKRFIAEGNLVAEGRALANLIGRSTTPIAETIATALNAPAPS